MNLRTPYRLAMIASLAALCTSAAPALAQQHGAHGGAHGGADHAAHASKPKTDAVLVTEGAVLTARPSSISFAFLHPMQLKAATLTTATGERVAVSFSAPEPAASATLTLKSPLSPDAYTLNWTADAPDHTMRGAIKFQVK